jgi:hypothetical protein
MARQRRTGESRETGGGGSGASEGGGGRLEPHPLVQSLMPEGGAPPNAVVLEGLPGHAPAPGRFLLWLSLNFDESVEGDEDDILHTVTLPDDGGTIVYVRADARLDYKQITSQSVEASFLGGDITSTYLGGAAEPEGPAEIAPNAAFLAPPSAPIVCRTAQPICRTRPIVCRTRLPLCRPTVPPMATCGFVCPTLLPRLCPTTPVGGCPPPTTPAAGCPAPTTPGAGCPPPTSPLSCQSVDICPTEFGSRCPTWPLHCPTAAWACPHTDEPRGCV